jgi:hypothetical protein
MYCITDEQIEYILNDIRRNGVEMEDLQLNLLDHICCIMEQELKETDDFEQFYQDTVRRFYKTELREIETETINLLTFKNYYAMKKVMLMSGASSVTAFIIGTVFKIMHWPGANILILLAIVTFSLVFLPIIYFLKSREATDNRQKAVVGMACITGIVFSLGILFKIMHWPGTNVLGMSAILLAAFGLLPLYFFTGIRHPETKMNTIMVSILLTGAIGLMFAMVNLRQSNPLAQARMDNYLQAEALLNNLSYKTAHTDTLSKDIIATCEAIKSMVLQNAIDAPALPAGKKPLIKEESPGGDFYGDGAGVKLVQQLRNAVSRYNAAQTNPAARIPTTYSVLESDPSHLGYDYSNLLILSSVTQLQLAVVVKEQQLASKG